MGDDSRELGELSEGLEAFFGPWARGANKSMGLNRKDEASLNEVIAIAHHLGECPDRDYLETRLREEGFRRETDIEAVIAHWRLSFDLLDLVKGKRQPGFRDFDRAMGLS